MDDRLLLSLLGLHPFRARALLESHGSPAAVLRAMRRGRIEITDRARQILTTGGSDHTKRLVTLGVAVVYRGGGAYPAHLRQRPDAPEVLFVRGTLPETPGVAVVGTRQCTAYGRRVAQSYGEAVAAAGWPLVSGLARGIDGAAHQGTVHAGGVGVAVLGSGPDVWYPREHRPLGEALLAAGGAIVTEYPPGSPPEAWRFPPRNRIISGLAAAVVVVEAKQTGGALITAMAALEQGIPVYAVPGDIDRPSSVGCNHLIRDGAHPVLDPADLIEELALVLGPPDPTPRPSGVDEVALPSTGMSVEAFVECLDLPIDEALAHLSRLESTGRIRRADGLILPSIATLP